MAPRPAQLVLPLVALALGLSSAAVASQPTPLTSSAARAVVPETADDLPPGSAIANEQIYQLTRAGDRIYAYGYFDTVGRYAGPGTVLSLASGQTVPSATIGDGQVSVSVSDGAGGWYLGGDFTRIDGQDAGGLAHVLADGTLDDGFLPVADGLVSALALVGDTLYVGGAFSTIDGMTRGRLAAVSTADGALLPFEAAQSTRVTELVYAPADGYSARLFVGSDGLHALDPTTGAAVPGFSATTDSPINALELGGGSLYVGGAEVVALDPATGAADSGFDTGTPLAVDSGRRVHTLLYTADRLYVGADRTLIGGEPGRLVAVDPETGDLDPTFAPDITSERNLEYTPAGVYDLALNGDDLWAAGSFAGSLTAVDAETGAAVDTDLPSYDLQANAVEISGDQAYVGGHFYMTDAVHTRGLAAFDAETLDPVPTFQASTRAYGDLFTGAGALWVASTHFMGYDPSQHAAESGQFFYPWTQSVDAFDLETGERIAERSLRVRNLTGITTIGDRVYVARRLENDERYPRNRVDVYGPTGKRVDHFNVPRRGYITQLGSLGGKLIVAGSFIGSPNRQAILKVNPTSGKRLNFDPQIAGPVYDVAASNGGLVATGLFKKVWDQYGVSRNRPGLTRVTVTGLRDGSFVPAPFAGNRVLLNVVPLGDLLWIDGAPSGKEFYDATTGVVVPDPTGEEFGPWWVTGTDADLTFTSFLMPNLGGRTGYKLGYVAPVD